MKKTEILENIRVEKLVFGGKGFTRIDGKAVFITGGAIPGSIVNLRILKKKKDFLETQITSVVKKSPIETGNYDVFPGAPWINIDYSEQLKIKQNQVEEALFHCKKYQEEISFLPIIGMENIFGYRNKIEFSFGKYISAKEERNEQFNIGFHARGEFSRVEDYKSCALIDEMQNEIYAKVRNFTRSSGYSAYDQKMSTGFWRHFMMRRMHFSKKILLVFSVNPDYFATLEEKNMAFEIIRKFILNELVVKFPEIASVYLSHNRNKADIIIGDMELVYGSEVIEEKLLGYSFDIGPKSFFQTNSVGAEILYSTVKDFFLCHSGLGNNTGISERQESSQSRFLHSQEGHGDTKMGTVLDLYAGTGTIGMIFSDVAEKVISVELVQEASENGEKNAQKNGVTNMEFVNAKVEDFLDKYLKDLTQVSSTRRDEARKADLLIIDPPRAGMHPSALPNILKFSTQQMIYVSCNPATLARDLEYILANSTYKIEKVQAVDMFPHTHHIETIVSLIQK